MNDPWIHISKREQRMFGCLGIVIVLAMIALGVVLGLTS